MMNEPNIQSGKANDEKRKIIFLRLKQILGDAKATPPILPMIPVSKSTWWAGIKSGRFPAPIKLTKKIVVWRSDTIEQFIVDRSGPTTTNHKS